jgi:hypothetical protein
MGLLTRTVYDYKTNGKRDIEVIISQTMPCMLHFTESFFGLQ